MLWFLFKASPVLEMFMDFGLTFSIINNRLNRFYSFLSLKLNKYIEGPRSFSQMKRLRPLWGIILFYIFLIKQHVNKMQVFNTSLVIFANPLWNQNDELGRVQFFWLPN